MRSHAKASSAGSNSGRGGSHQLFFVTLVLCLCASVCLLPGSASAAETRPLVDSFGPSGNGATSFESPSALAFDQGNKHLFALDAFAAKIYGFDVSAPATYTPLGGNFPLAVEGGGEVPDLAADSTSHIFYYLSEQSSSLYAFNAAGNETAGSLGYFPLHGFSFPCGAAVDPSGKIWVAEYSGKAVKEYEPAGSAIQTVDVSAHGNPCHLALDSNSNLYVSFYEGAVWKYSAASSYTVATEVDPVANAGNPIAVDRTTDELYVAHPGHVSVFGPSGNFIYEFGDTVAGANFTGIAFNEARNEVYLADAGHSKVDVFGPLALPNASTEDADSVATTTATLHGTVNPEGKPLTDCHLEYVTEAAFKSTGFSNLSSGGSVPCVPDAASIPADSTAHAVSAAVTGLAPSTPYRFRLVAGNANGTVNGLDKAFITGPPTIAEQQVETVGATDVTVSAKINPKGIPTTYHVDYGATTSYGQSSVESAPIGFVGDNSAHIVSVHIGGLNPGTAYHFRFVATSTAGKAEGLDTTFATYPTVPPLGACSNDQFRTGFGLRLPDCRAYEQVTPVDKHGANVQGAPGGAQASSGGDRVTFYTTGGLPTTGGSSTLSPFMASRSPSGWSTDGLIPLLEPGRDGAVVGWSDDLRTTFDRASTSGDGNDYYLRDDSGAYQLLFSSPANLAGARVRLDGFAADTEHFAFEVRAALLPGAAAGGQQNLYDFNHGTLTLPGRVPIAPATSCDDAGAPACVPAPEGALTGAGTEGGGLSAHSAISRDGSKVFFTDRASRQIFVREDATRTVQVSASQKTNGTGPGGSDPLGPQPALFREATPDGAQFFFTSPEELTDDANTGIGPAIGRANLDGSSPDHSFVPLSASVGGMAVDGAHVYWVNPNANTISRSNLDGTGVEASFISGASKPQYVAVDGAHIYWTNAATGVNGAGTIGRSNLDGTGVEQSFVTGASNPQGIAVDGSHIYWANAGTTEATRAIGRANLDGTSPNQSFVAVTEGTLGPAGVAVNSTFIYWSNMGNDKKFLPQGNIGRATIAGASPQQGFIAGATHPRGLALDGSYLYWANNNDGLFGPAVARAKLDGSQANRTFTHTAAPMQGLALDGSHLYWAAGDARDTGNDLYRYDSVSGGLSDLTPDSEPGDLKGADVHGFLGASPDGSYVYFAANGVLAAGASPGEVVSGVEVNGGFPTTPTNLYVSHAGAVKFITQLDRGGESFSFVADDGTIVFASQRVVDLSGHDHGSCGSGCREFYRYTPTDEGLTCITCITGIPPSSPVNFGSSTGSFLSNGVGMAIRSRNLSADGNRFFFETSDPLLPSDTDGTLDVYEWEAKGSGTCESESQNGGCLYLISSGTSPSGAHFLDASADGDHAFFFTNQQLVPGDGDQLTDVYDAAVDGGLASQHQLAPPTCAGTACQANPAPPPDPGLASASYSGAGNVHEGAKAHRCPKGKRRVRHGGKVRCQKAHKAKHHKRHSNRGGSK